MHDTNNKDLAPERHAKIAELLQRKPVVRVNELCGQLGVSPASVRRDLAVMEQLGRVQRVHGGAMSTGPRKEEPLFDDKTAMAAGEKQRIAEAALKLIHPTDSIFLDGGSTVLALAALLTSWNRLTVVTNSLRVASTLSGAGPHTILTGGELRRVSQTFVGPLTRPLMEQVHVDRAFMGTIGLSLAEGLTTTDAREALTKELVMAHARQVVLLADSSKLGHVSFVRFGELKSVQTLITDTGATPQTVRPFQKLGIKVIRA